MRSEIGVLVALVAGSAFAQVSFPTMCEFEMHRRRSHGCSLTSALIVGQREKLDCRNTCPGTFKSVSASAWVKAANPGWNAGNTLDAVPDEGSWNNPKLQASTFDYAKKAGFKAIRLPGMA
jgi:aryl-phospho-beta-D-glucosidase BglC (GH1 family)